VPRLILIENFIATAHVSPLGVQGSDRQVMTQKWLEEVFMKQKFRLPSLVRHVRRYFLYGMPYKQKAIQFLIASYPWSHCLIAPLFNASIQSGAHSTRILETTFLRCALCPFSSPDLMIPGKVTQRISRSPKVSSSSPPMSSMISASNIVRWCPSMDGITILKTAFWTRSSRDRSIELPISPRRDWSLASELCASLIEHRMLFTWATTVSTTSAVSLWSFCGASFRRMARVVERHWFMLSVEPGINQICTYGFIRRLVHRAHQKH